MQTWEVKYKFPQLKIKLDRVSRLRVSVFIAYLLSKGADKGFVPVTYRELEEIGIYPPTARLIKQQLQERGVIKVKKGRKGGLGGSTADQIKLNLNRLEELEYGENQN